MGNKKILVITGPTATGKTALGVRLAKKLNGEVVSADSMQIYRKMDIGTAKPDAEEMDGVRHHMLDVVEPEDNYSAARYVEDASVCVDDILSRGKLPIVVGGTGLYIDSLISGRKFAVFSPESGVRDRLEAEFDENGGEFMLKKLREIDSEAAARLAPADRKRIIRAIEVFEETGKTITRHNLESRSLPPRYDALKIALTFENRKDLYARIDTRVDIMRRRGLTEEVRNLLKLENARSSTAMQAIGYKELADAIDGLCTEDEAYEKIKQESRRYAKRQLTWFRRDPQVKWIVWKDKPDIEYGVRTSTEYLEESGYTLTESK